MKLRALTVLGLFLATTASTCDDISGPPPDTCEEGVTNPFTIGTPTVGAVAGGDCLLPDGDGHHGDSYTFTLADQSTLAFHVTGSTETIVRIRDNGITSGEQDVLIRESGQADYGGFAVLKAGSYTLDIAADEDDASGDYTIGSNILAPPLPANCVQPPNNLLYAMVGITVDGILTGGDCQGSGTAHYDNYIVKLTAGQARTITITTSSATGGTMEIRPYDNPGTLATTPTARNTPGDIVKTFTPAVTQYYTIGVLGAPGSGTINYTLKIQ